MRTTRLVPAGVLLLAIVYLLSRVGGQPPSPVQELRTQKVGDSTYFHLRLNAPSDMLSEDQGFDQMGFFSTPEPNLSPRLVAPSGTISHLARRLDWQGPGRRNEPGAFTEKDKDDPKRDKDSDDAPSRPVPVRGLEFVGRVQASGVVKVKLLYPISGRPPRLIGRLVPVRPQTMWKETQIVLDFSKAKNVPVPAQAKARSKGTRSSNPVQDDLEGLWAVAQADHFASLDRESREFGYFAFAARTLARRYHIPDSPALQRTRWSDFQRDRSGGDVLTGQMYQMTTGSAALAESLQLRRMNPNPGRGMNPDKRSIPIAKVRGIDIAEHPWEKMMAGQKPAPEPLAMVIPHDNYYIHFKSVARLLEFAELVDRWGGNITGTYAVTNRDHRLRQRYERQLCLQSALLGKLPGDVKITEIGITGSDAYLTDGTDIAVLFEVDKPREFLAVLDPLVGVARKQFGDALKESREDYHDITTESCVTPLREVSLHRAVVGSFVVCANSDVGLRRIIDTHQGRGKRLADSLDFQYMRTIFRNDAGPGRNAAKGATGPYLTHEDGFAFLSDAFIRAQVGPVSKIKQRRRLEALVSLHMLTHGAMYTAWETGKQPSSDPNLLNATGLTRDELPVPEGKPAYWDPKLQLARSDAYGSVPFATPLVELPLDVVTPTEAAEYDRFRAEYMGLWRQFFDPVGMRLAFKDGTVQLDTYILPLIVNTQYNQLRQVTGLKSVRFDPASLSDKTLIQFLLRLNDDVNARGSLFGMGGRPRGLDDLTPLVLLGWAMDPVGEWFLVRLDDSPVYEKLMEFSRQMEKGQPVDGEEVARQAWKMPLAIGFQARNPLVLAGALTSLRTSAMFSLPGALTWEPMEKPYKEVSIVRVGATPAGRRMLGPLGPGGPERANPFLPALYYAMIGDGFYLTLNVETMHSLIDQATAKSESKGTIETAASLHLAPGAAKDSRGMLRYLLEKQTFSQARAVLPIWDALYRTGVVLPGAKPEEANEAAYRYLGYVPVSPDGSPYTFDQRFNEVTNERHGSMRRPTPHQSTLDTSPRNFLLDQIGSIRADLRFREDGIHTVLTLRRGESSK